MRLKFYIGLLSLLISFLTLKSQNPVEISKQLFSFLKSSDYNKIDALFDTTSMMKFINLNQTAAYKKELETLGKPKKLIALYDEPAGCKTRTALAIQFKKEKKLLKILFNSQNKIESLSFEEKYTETPFFQLKGYQGFSEVTDLTTEIKTRDGLKLGANIAFGDTSKDKCPLVIFVHGSGPNDRDATIGPNKVFRDMAQGLAQQGIVSLRYDKRTYAYQFDTNVVNDSMTIYKETINDAIDAVNVAKQFSFIDTTKIFVVGLSQGAMCAPKIAELCPKLAGIIMMAGPANNLLVVLQEQMEYQANLDGVVSDKEQMQLTSVKWMVNKIKDPNLSDKTPKAALMGAHPKYWKSFLNYNQVETARKLTLPIYILNGERDVQVLMKEFNLWQKELADKKNVQFKSYPLADHLFLEFEGKPNPNEYFIPNHVPQHIIDDLTRFIKN